MNKRRKNRSNRIVRLITNNPYLLNSFLLPYSIRCKYSAFYVTSDKRLRSIDLIIPIIPIYTQIRKFINLKLANYIQPEEIRSPNRYNKFTIWPKSPTAFPTSPSRNRNEISPKRKYSIRSSINRR